MFRVYKTGRQKLPSATSVRVYKAKRKKTNVALSTRLTAPKARAIERDVKVWRVLSFIQQSTVKPAVRTQARNVVGLCTVLILDFG